MKNRTLLKQIAIDALFIALIIIFTFVPYTGYITIGILSFTTIHVFVLLGALLFGWKRGLLYGFVFGLSSLVKAISYPGTADYLFLNPFISVLPRVLFGLISGLVFDGLKAIKNKKLMIGLLYPMCGVLTFVHTLLTLTCLYVFGVLNVFGISGLLGLDKIIESFNSLYPNIWIFLGGFLSIGCIGEIAVAVIVVPSVYLLVYNRNVKNGVQNN